MEHDKIIELLKVTDIEGHDLEAGLGVDWRASNPWLQAFPLFRLQKKIISFFLY